MLRRLLLIMLVQLQLVSLCGGKVAAPPSKSDRETKGLKGQAHTVTDEVADFIQYGDALSEGARTISSLETYDPQGNLTQVEYYFKGELHSRITFFDLDGWRASKSEVFILLKGSGGIAGPAEPGTPDPRFNRKYEYKYDKQGNRVEVTEINSYGRKFAITTYKYDAGGNLLESNETRYLYRVNPPELRKKTVYQLNEKGEPMRMTEPTSQADYSDYKYDNKGNWISRKVRSQTELSNQTHQRLQSEYRTITYYTTPVN